MASSIAHNRAACIGGPAAALLALPTGLDYHRAGGGNAAGEARCRSGGPASGLA